MNTSSVLSSLTATYRYLKYALREARPAEADTVHAYLEAIKPLFEAAAVRNGYVIEWNTPVIYVQELFKRLPTISEYAQFSRGRYVQSDSTLEFVLYDGCTRKEMAGMLFIENSLLSHTVNCRILSKAGTFAHEGRGSLDFIMQDRQWAEHEAVLRKAIDTLLTRKAPAKKRPDSGIAKAA